MPGQYLMMFRALCILKFINVPGDVVSIVQPHRKDSVRSAKVFLVEHCHFSRAALDTMSGTRVKIAAWLARAFAPAAGNPTTVALRTVVQRADHTVLTQEEWTLRRKAYAVLRQAATWLTCGQAHVVSSFSNFVNFIWSAVASFHTALQFANSWCAAHPVPANYLVLTAHIHPPYRLDVNLTAYQAALVPLVPPAPPPLQSPQQPPPQQPAA